MTAHAEPSIVGEQRLHAEAEISRMLEAYILNEGGKFLFSGVVNLLTTIAAICEEQSRVEGDDWEIAAQAIDECAEQCDLKYEAT